MITVSIITPLYNCAIFVEQTIQSVLAQTFQDWEMVLVDDCSVDSSWIIAQRYVSKDHRIKLIKLDQNSGAAIARNKAIELAQGRYIAFLDSDDQWLPHKLEAQLQFMQNNDIAFSYSAYERINENGKPIDTVGVPTKVNYSDLLKVCSIGCLTAMYDTKKLGKVYMPLIRKRQDLGLWLRILKKVPYAYGIQQPLARYQVRPDSISANKRSAARYTWRLYRDVEHLNFAKAIYYFCFYAVNGVFRTKFPHIARKLGLLK